MSHALNIATVGSHMEYLRSRRAAPSCIPEELQGLLAFIMYSVNEIWLF